MSQVPQKRKIQIVTIAKESLLLLQFAKFYDGGFQNITGSVEKDETFIEAAERELFEEIGIKEKLKDINLTFNFLDRWGFMVEEKVYLCDLDAFPSIQLSEEHQGFKWIPLKEVLRKDFVFPTNFDAFKRALDFKYA